MSGFDGVAGAVAARVMAQRNADMEQAAAALAAPAGGERVLVVGFGPGVGLVALLDAASPAYMLGVDPSPTMVKAARRRLASHPRRAVVDLRAESVAEIPPTGDIDVAVAVNCEQLWHPHRAVLATLAAALRPGARLVTLTHEWALARHHDLDNWAAVASADLAATGFETPSWTNGHYRSGPATGYTARRRCLC